MLNGVILEKNSINKVGELLNKVKPLCKVLIVTDNSVPKIYSEKVIKSVTDIGYTASVITLLSGENTKTLDTVQEIINTLSQNNFSRNDLLIGVGGGVIGDITGFTASVFLRGIDYCLIPTTLLALCDASIGGKTGVNYNGYKNYIGSFYKPILVIEDTDLLATLPKIEMLSGYGEIIKCAILCGGDFYNALKTEQGIDVLVRYATEYKSKIVENDFKEKGDRIFLNFGHTVGHAIEEYSNFEIKHGICVLYGIYYAVDYSVKIGLLQKNQADDIKEIIKNYGVDKPENLDKNKLQELIKSDKKHDANKIKLVCLKGIGKPCVVEVDFDNLGEIL